MFEGKSLFMRVFWAFILYIEVQLKIVCMLLTVIIVAQSSNQFDLLANAFGIFVLVEYSNLASNYIMMNIENE